MNHQVRLWAFGLLLVVPPAALAADTRPQAPEPSKMHCRLDIARKSELDPKKFVGDFSLKNTSSEPIKIEYRVHPLVHLDLDVKDQRGTLLPKALIRYGGIFSPFDFRPEILTIKPGETYRAGIVLFVQVDKEEHPITPGKYIVEAVFQWDDQEVRSNKVAIEVLPATELRCRLLVKERRHPVGEEFPGVFELRNDTRKPITIEYLNDPLEHLALDVTLDVRGPAPNKSLPKARPFYGGLPKKPGPEAAEKKKLTIEVGETYRRDVSVFAQTDQAAYPITPGEYWVEAVYTWDGMEIRSDKLPIMVQAK